MMLPLYRCMFLLLLCFPGHLLAQPAAGELESFLDAQFAHYNENTPGFAVGIMKGGVMIFKKGYGSADLENGIPIDPKQSVFNLASASKQFTVLAIMLLEEEGRLSLDDDVHKYLPELSDFGKRVTLRHMAANVSGIRSDMEMMGMAGYTNDDLLTHEMVLKMTLRQQELNFIPGEEFLYSNANFVLLAEIVEKVAEMSFPSFLKKRIFDPLGMSNTFVMDDYHSLVPHRAYAYGFGNGVYQNDFIQSNIFGSTGIYTTLVDLAKWAANFQEIKVGSASIFQKMSTPFVLNNGNNSPYGLGLFVERYKGLRQVHHAGGSGSYRSFISSYPDQDLTVLLLSNDGNVYIAGELAKIADVLLKADFPTVESVPTAGPLFEEISTVDLVVVEGAYLNDKDYYVRNIAVRNDSLFYRRPEQNNRESYLTPLGGKRFAMTSTTPILYVDFKENEMEVYTDENDISTFSSITPRDYSSADLKILEGLYFSEELQTTYELEVVNEQLTINHPRFSPITLRPVSTDGFLSNSWRFNYLIFERNATGGIQGFRISSSRVKHLKFRRI